MLQPFSGLVNRIFLKTLSQGKGFYAKALANWLHNVGVWVKFFLSLVDISFVTLRLFLAQYKAEMWAALFWPYSYQEHLLLPVGQLWKRSCKDRGHIRCKRHVIYCPTNFSACLLKVNNVFLASYCACWVNATYTLKIGVPDSYLNQKYFVSLKKKKVVLKQVLREPPRHVVS